MTQNPVCNSDWQLIIKVARCKNRKFKWCGFAYEAKYFRGDLIFSGGASSVSTSDLVAVQDAIVEASIKARDFGFRKFLQQDGFDQCQEKSLIIYQFL